MSEEQLYSEKMYRVTMSVFGQMVKNGLISRKEFDKINAVFLEKYHPIFGTILPSIA